MSDVVIWHNPRCSKSRATLALLRERGVDPVVRLYLEDAPDAAELHAVLKLLGMRPAQMMRLTEPEARGLGADSAEADLFAAMTATPKLIERPVVLANGKAAIGRPPEKVLDIL